MSLMRKFDAVPRNSPAPDPALLAILQEMGLEDVGDSRFQELIEIINLSVQVHGRKAREWFLRPEPELGFVHPATLLRDPANGRRLVKQSLMNHLRGPYTLGSDGEVLPKERIHLAPSRGGELSGPKKKRRLPRN